jgi:outer membrane protein assembly factor BamB
MRDRRLHDWQLDQFWDDLVRGEQAINADGLDPDEAEVVRAFQQFAQAPMAPRLSRIDWRRALPRTVPPPSLETADMDASLPWNTAPSRERPLVPRTARSSRPQWWERGVSLIGVAALIIAMIGGVYFSYHEPNQPTLPAIVASPGPVATPAPSPTDGWSMYRANVGRTGAIEAAGPLADPTERWRFQAGGRINDAPAIANGVLYAAGADGSLYALNVSTGALIWKTALGVGSGASVMVQDGLVIIGDDNKDLRAFDAATGAERWRDAGLGTTDPGPVVNGVLYNGGTDGKLHAVDAATGVERWSTSLGGGVSRSTSYASGTLFVGSGDGHVNALNATTGALLWSVALGGGTIGTPAVRNGVVYASSFGGPDNKLLTLNAADGTQRWSFQTAAKADLRSPAVGADALYTVSGDGTIYALDLTTGKTIFAVATQGPITAAPALAGATVYAASRDGNIYAVDATTGAERWRHAYSSTTDYGPVIAGGVVYVTTDAGAVIALGDGAATPESGATPQSPSGTPIAAASLVPSGPPAFAWASRGGAGAMLNKPLGVAVAPDGVIWVADTPGEFKIFDATGAYRETWGQSGSAPNQLSFDQAGNIAGWIAFAPDGSFYVSDFANARYDHYGANRQLIGTIGPAIAGFGTLTMTGGIALAPDGTLYLSDGASTVLHVRPDGALIGAFNAASTADGQFNVPASIAIDGQGRLIVSENGAARVRVFDKDWKQLGALDLTGQTPPFWNGPIDVAVDAAGDIYVADQNNSLVRVFGPDLRFKIQWGAQAGDGRLTNPGWLALGPGGAIYVTDDGDNRLVRFNAVNQPAVSASPTVSAAASPLSFAWSASGDAQHALVNPGSVGVDPSGRIWVSSMPGSFLIFDLDGNYLETWGTPGKAPGQFSFDGGSVNFGGVTFAPDGGFYVADLANARIEQFDKNRALVRVWGAKGSGDGQFQTPVCVAIAGDGNLLVSDFTRDDVQKFSPSGVFISKFGSTGAGDGQFNNVGCLAVASDGTIWAPDMGDNRIEVFHPDGTFAFSFGGPGGNGQGQLSAPFQVVLDDAGNAYVADQNNNLIQVFDHDGHFLYQFGGFGAGDGQFNTSSSIAIYRGKSVIVLDWRNNRIEKFKISNPGPAPAATPMA